MIQFNHINALLRNYKMGVKIRFEHHLINWRIKNGVPLKSVELNQPYTHCCTYQTNLTNGSTDNNGTKRKKHNYNVEETDHIESEEKLQLLSPQSATSNNSLFKIMPTSEMANLMPTTLQEITTTNDTTHSSDDEGEMENMPLTALNELLSNPANNSPHTKFPSKPAPDKCQANLKRILRLSGSRGMSIVKFYKEKSRLTNIHRSQLIQTIVDFFDENDYHLTLNMSHNLEWEILKMFPTERLEYYRTEKRGKIYVKFSNMKRYKRERNNKVNSEIETHLTRSSRRIQPQNSDNNETAKTLNLVSDETENLETSNCEDWYLTTEPEILVKEENISDQEFGVKLNELV